MASTGHLPSKKRRLQQVELSDYNPFGTDDDDSSSSASSFEMEHPSSDEEEGHTRNTFQVKLMDSQDTNMSFTPTLGTQPPPKATLNQPK